MRRGGSAHQHVHRSTTTACSRNPAALGGLYEGFTGASIGAVSSSVVPALCEFVVLLTSHMHSICCSVYKQHREWRQC